MLGVDSCVRHAISGKSRALCPRMTPAGRGEDHLWNTACNNLNINTSVLGFNLICAAPLREDLGLPCCFAEPKGGGGGGGLPVSHKGDLLAA